MIQRYSSRRSPLKDFLAAKLMALYGDRPILILVPKPLMIQWQDELWDLLEMPSARWNGRQWIDEQGVAYPEFGPQGMKKCPRRCSSIRSRRGIS
jgi:hypothetical protein